MPTTAILGISALYHDAAAALVLDGRIVAAAQEERFTRQKHDAALPTNAIDYCLREAGLAVGDLDHVGFYEKPLLRFNRLLETYIAVTPRGFRSFRQAMPSWLERKLHVPRELDRLFAGRYRGSYVFCDHHEGHAASAFFASPFEEAAIVTMDGVGEWATASIGSGSGNRITLTHELRFPHSLGLLYSAFTYYLGFKVNGGEYKVMGLAPYGEPRFAAAIRTHLLDLRDDGSFTLDMSYFAYCHDLTMTSPKFHQLFGGKPRHPEAPLTQREMDLAASVQLVAEEVMLRVCRHAHDLTGMSHLVLAGGVALNCVANGRILREGPFADLWIQPAAGDAGGALGVALFIWFQQLGNARTPTRGDDGRCRDRMQGALLGPGWTDDEIRGQLDALGVPYELAADDAELCQRVAQSLADGSVVGWFHGRMEYGPRALGARSILGDPRRPGMQSLMNRKIKFRESFRPFAPAVLARHSREYFDLDRESPYMLLVATVAEAQQRRPAAIPATVHERLQQERSTIPAVTHVDMSARVQTVTREHQPRFHDLLQEFHRQTGCPVLINTSFNVRGEPIVASPRDAYDCFLRTGMDVLVLGRCVMRKAEQRSLRLGHRDTIAGDWGAIPCAAPAAGYLDD